MAWPSPISKFFVIASGDFNHLTDDTRPVWMHLLRRTAGGRLCSMAPRGSSATSAVN